MLNIKLKLAALSAIITSKFTRAANIVANPQEPTLETPVINIRGESTFEHKELNRQERRAINKSLRKKGNVNA